MSTQREGKNVDPATVEGFGAEWAAFDQTVLTGDEYDALFQSYFGIFHLDELLADAEGFDLGCGSGRWALGIAGRVGTLHCIDPSEKALAVARRKLASHANVQFHCATADSIPLNDGSQDFGYSLGVLHHVPDTRSALAACVRKLRPGAPFLLYLYYALDDRPRWFRAAWKASDLVRRSVSRLPFGVKRMVTNLIAAGVYWPLAHLAKVAEKLGADVSNIPLGGYRKSSFYSMRTDALDRFGTRLEHRFTRGEIETMMRDAGLVDIGFSDREPFWVACGRRRPA